MKDLTGERFGRWTVFGLAEKKCGATYFLCRCDCGAEKAVAKSSLICGKSNSCGCLNKELLAERKIDIVGNRYGRLVVTAFNYSDGHGNLFWKCHCDCGNDVVVNGKNLLGNEGTRSCGCWLKDKIENRFEDLTGKKFGRLLITGYLGKDNYSQQRWSYICDCGTVKSISRNSLLSAGTQSCGCLAKEINEARAEDLIGQKFGRLTVIDKAERRGNVIRWKCKCDCGNYTNVDSAALKSERTKSCGCLSRELSQNRAADLTGQRFGRLLVIERDISQENRIYWLCKCDCQGLTSVRGDSLIEGNTKSCGCLSPELTAERCTTHGLSNTRLYSIYRGMHQRCNNSNCDGYKDYGGRGIRICAEWLENFMSFYNWALSNGYDDSLSIDRINVNGNYEPNNCRWATTKEQNRNTRKNVFIEIKGKVKTLAEWAEISGINSNVIKYRWAKGKRDSELLVPKDTNIIREKSNRERLLGILSGVKSRCLNPNNDAFKHYGGRGIIVCREWVEDFNNFYIWATTNGYSSELTLDRIDVNGNYEPGNCRWSTTQEQSNNKRNNIFLTYGDETKTIAQWSRDLGVSPNTLKRRVEVGMPNDKIFNKGKLYTRDRKVKNAT